MNRRNKIILSVGIIILLGFIVIGIIALLPYPSPEVTPSNYSTEIYQDFTKVGIENVVVDTTKERVLVRYEVPNNLDRENSTKLVIQVVTTTVYDRPVIIQIYEDFRPIEQLTVDIETIQEYNNGHISLDEVKNRIERKRGRDA